MHVTKVAQLFSYASIIQLNLQDFI